MRSSTASSDGRGAIKVGGTRKKTRTRTASFVRFVLGVGKSFFLVLFKESKGLEKKVGFTRNDTDE